MADVQNKQILIKFKDNAIHQHILNHVKDKHCIHQIDMKKTLKHSNAALLDLCFDDDYDAIVSTLHNNEDVHYAQPDYALTACSQPCDDKFNLEWGLYNEGQADRLGNMGVVGLDIDILEAWNLTKGDPNLVVAIVDTGTDINHIDLKNNIYCAPPNTCFKTLCSDQNYYGKPEEWDFVDTNPKDYDSVTDAKHGTRVAGIIAACENDSGIVGVAPNVKILPLKFMNSQTGPTSDAIEAIEYAKALGVKIINCSWGGSDNNPALKHHMADSDILFVCASGNCGNNVSETPFYPACLGLPNILSVAAINNRGELWAMSNYGSSIDVAAPGTSIISTVSCDNNNDYDYDTGTSMATPFVTGIAALLLSLDANLSAEKIKELILSSVKELPGLKDKTKTGGIVNAYLALEKIKKEC